jgi:hypothetical protein
MLSSQIEIKQSVFNIEISEGNEQLDYFQLIELMNKQAGYKQVTGRLQEGYRQVTGRLQVFR